MNRARGGPTRGDGSCSLLGRECDRCALDWARGFVLLTGLVREPYG